MNMVVSISPIFFSSQILNHVHVHSFEIIEGMDKTVEMMKIICKIFFWLYEMREREREKLKERKKGKKC